MNVVQTFVVFDYRQTTYYREVDSLAILFSPVWSKL